MNVLYVSLAAVGGLLLLLGLLGGLLQIARPEQPMVAVREAHVHSHVLFSPVPANDLADHAPPL